MDYAAKDAADVAKIAKTKWDLGLAGGMLIGNPVPEEFAMDFDEMSAIIDKALASANADGVRGKSITPYLLAHIVEYTQGRSLATNIQLAYNNARVVPASPASTPRCKRFSQTRKSPLPAGRGLFSAQTGYPHAAPSGRRDMVHDPLHRVLQPVSASTVRKWRVRTD